MTRKNNRKEDLTILNIFWLWRDDLINDEAFKLAMDKFKVIYKEKAECNIESNKRSMNKNIK